MDEQRVEIAVRAVELVSEHASQISTVAAAMIAIVAGLSEFGALRKGRLLLVAFVSLALCCVAGFLVAGKAAGELAAAASNPGLVVEDLVALLSPYGGLSLLSRVQIGFFLGGLGLLIIAALLPRRRD